MSLALFFPLLSRLFFFNPPPTPEIYTLSLHDALPISVAMIALGTALALPCVWAVGRLVEAQLYGVTAIDPPTIAGRPEEHTSELQSRVDLVCRLLLEKKKNKKTRIIRTRIQKYSTSQR